MQSNAEDEIQKPNEALTPIPIRDRSGRFVTSGNPNGRRKGSRNRITVLGEKLQNEGPEVWDKILSEAKQGVPAAYKLVANRTVAPLREPYFTFDFPEVNSLDDVEGATGAVMAALSNAQITPSVAETMAKLIELQRRNLLVNRQSAKEIDVGDVLDPQLFDQAIELSRERLQIDIPKERPKPH